VKKFSDLMRGSELIVAPVALNPIMARLAEEAGFKRSTSAAARSAG
jgi:2-methylisocitrate lyase-like PEP mutase family enzyme